MLGLQCEFACKPENHKAQDIIREAQRNRISKHMECPWKVNINWPPEKDESYISFVEDVHNHDLHENFDTRILEKLNAVEIELVEHLSLIAAISQRQIVQVSNSSR
jgi:hypothetical protein